MKKIILLATIASLAATPAAFAASGKASRAQAAEPGQRIGALSCEIEGGVGLILSSSKKVQCQFRQQNGKVERYTGSIGKLGLDIGVTGKTYLNWVVVSTAASRIGEGSLAGSYVGASASAAAGVGVGANALIGGNSRNFALQPVSAQVGTGLNVAAGVSRLQLNHAG
ncbi:hypothetical protein ASD54_17140 [Rhizobium sp. Root149]|uniref:DUF992 domain-containing protein n=1 Tax=Rhizobium sp. Root149 TaxID=1736473 RepID=UPI000714D3D8|nr:DUF992 domain-containing protein [Rhizobium sp. Root149]KQZ48586.1 hypothetical protein ASD54_17140 [Rhizobium sp. Root149]